MCSINSFFLPSASCINRLFKVEHISETCLTVKHSHYPSIYFLSRLFPEPCKVFLQVNLGPCFYQANLQSLKKCYLLLLELFKRFLMHFEATLKHLDKPRSFFVWEIGVDVLKGENRASDNVPVKSRPSKKKQQCKWRSLFGCVKNKVKSWAIDRIDDLY